MRRMAAIGVTMYESLSNILRESREDAREAERRRMETKLQQCPSCAFEPLRENKRGDQLCPICGWVSSPLGRIVT